MQNNYELPLGLSGLEYGHILKRAAIGQYNEVRSQIEQGAVVHVLTYFGFTEWFIQQVLNSNSSFENRELRKFYMAIRSITTSALSPGTTSEYRMREKLRDLPKTFISLNQQILDSLSDQDKLAIENLINVSNNSFARTAQELHMELEEERKVKTQAATHVSRIRAITDWLNAQESGKSKLYGEVIVDSMYEFTSWCVKLVEDFFIEREKLFRYKASYVKIWITHCADVFQIPIEKFPVTETETDFTTRSSRSWKSYKSFDQSLPQRFIAARFNDNFHNSDENIFTGTKTESGIPVALDKVTMEISMADESISAKFLIPKSRIAEITMMQIQLFNFVATQKKPIDIQITTTADSILLSTSEKGAINEFGSVLLESLKILNNEN